MNFEKVSQLSPRLLSDRFAGGPRPCFRQSRSLLGGVPRLYPCSLQGAVSL